jgi:thiosulfate/3-mercaptopyruvate sulfurtransferase
MMWATRVWWMLRSVGFDRAAVLDGGFDAWQGEGRAIERGEPEGYPPATFTPRPRPSHFVDKTTVRAAIGDPRTVTVNSLTPQSFRGLGPSPYLRPGRVPGSVNVPSASLIDPLSKRFVSPAEALARFTEAGVTRDRRVIAYCGAAISASIDLFMLHQLGFDDLTLYDGSLLEWAEDPSLPIETD